MDIQSTRARTCPVADGTQSGGDQFGSGSSRWKAWSGRYRAELLASVIQTGQLQGIAYRELETRVLKGGIPFQFGPGPPAPK